MQKESIEALDTMLTVDDLAGILSVGRRTIWRWATEGRIPNPIKISERCIRWKASEIQEYLDSLKAN